MVLDDHVNDSSPQAQGMAYGILMLSRHDFAVLLIQRLGGGIAGFRITPDGAATSL